MNMQPLRSARSLVTRYSAAAALALLAPLVACAFPPAPNHTIYGVVRDEMGDPIVVTNAVVILETATGVQVKTTVVPGLAPGMNYRLRVPMDAGLTSDNYKPTALRPLVSFTIKVKIGQTTFLPMELHGAFASLGAPAKTTHLDLTLGEDSDGDGLPDAWERALIDRMGGKLTLADIKPGADSDGDGLTNLQEYLAGTYAFDPLDGLPLTMAGMNQGRPQMDFMAIRGRSYGILTSNDMLNWTPVDFRVVDGGADNSVLRTYTAVDVRVVRAEVVSPDGQPVSERAFFQAHGPIRRRLALL